MITLTRVKKMWDRENECPENCTCDCCADVKKEFEVRENLTDEEIEEIINSEYSDKNELTKNFIRKGLKKFGNKFLYYKTNIPDNTNLVKNNIKVIVTCYIHNDIELLAYYFLGNYYKGCHECIHGRPFVRNMGLDEFERRLKINFPHYSIIPGVSEYKNDRTKIKIHCDKHDEIFSIRPADIFRSHGGCKICHNERVREIGMKAHKEAEASLIKRIEEKFPGQFDFSKVDYKNHLCSLKIKCNTCGKVIERSVLIWNRRLKNRDILCPECEKEPKRLKRMEKFKSKVEKAFPKHFDLSNVNFITYHVPATGFKCLKCGAEFDVPYPDNFLVGAGCPRCDSSMGESFIRNWLENNKNTIDFYTEQLSIDNSIIVGRRDDWGVVIDFSLEYKNTLYWIEYNGEQHYIKNKHFHKNTDAFNAQLRRDDNVKKYCKNNNIILIEIPYTYHKQEQINFILNKIILENIKPEEIIEIPSISYYRTKKEKEEAKKNGKL